jgi:hypothetical protein
MARNITLTLGAGLGVDLGPNFNLTANVGSVTPSTATKSELTAGKSVSVDDAATEVTITSTGTCTNTITQTIPCAGETTTTTTLGYVTFTLAYSTIDGETACSNYPTIDTTNYYAAPASTLTTGTIIYTDTALTIPASNGFYSNGTNYWNTGAIPGAGNLQNQTACSGNTTSTTTEPPTTTTTTAGITYDNYHADQYDCATCTLQSVDTVIAFPTGTSVTVDKWYAPESLNGYVYRLTSLTPQTGPGLIMLTSEFNSCAFACMV